MRATISDHLMVSAHTSPRHTRHLTLKRGILFLIHLASLSLVHRSFVTQDRRSQLPLKLLCRGVVAEVVGVEDDGAVVEGATEDVGVAGEEGVAAGGKCTACKDRRYFLPSGVTLILDQGRVV